MHLFPCALLLWQLLAVFIYTHATLLQVLLALYFFLAGVVVSRRPMLALMPVSSAAFTAMHVIVNYLSTWLLPQIRSVCNGTRDSKFLFC